MLKAYDSEIMKGGNLTERLTRINNLNSQMSKKAEKLYEKAKKELSGLMEQRNNTFNIAEWQKQMLHEAISSLNQLVKQINKMNIEGKPVIDLNMFQQEKEKIIREATSIADLNKKLNQLTEILKAIFTEYQRLRAQLDELGIDGNCRFLKVYEDEVMNGADLTQRLEIIKAQNARCLAVKENMTSLNQLIQKRETRFIIDPSLLANQKKIIMDSGGSIEDVNKQLKSLSVMVETIGQEDQHMRENLSHFDEKILQMYDAEVTKSDNLAQKLKIITDLKASLARFRETMNRNYLTQDSLRRDIDKIKINDKHIINLDMQETIEPWEDFTSLENYFKSCTETADLSIKRLSLLKEALLKYAELHKQLKDLGFGENDSHMNEFLSGLDEELSSYSGTKQEILDNVVKKIIKMRMVILGLESNRVHMQIQALKTHPDNNMTSRIEQIMITLPIEARVTMSKSTDKAMEKILKSNPVPEATASKPSTGPQVTCPTQGVESGLIAIQANENESDAIVSLRQKLIELEQEILNHNFKLHRGGGSPYDNKSPKKFPNGAIEVLRILHKLNTPTPRASTKDLHQGMRDIMDAVQNKQEPVTCTNRFFHGKRDEDTISEYTQIIKTAESAIAQLEKEIYASTAESFKVCK